MANLEPRDGYYLGNIQACVDAAYKRGQEDEREACAKIAESKSGVFENVQSAAMVVKYTVAREIAAVIRARKEIIT